MASLGWLDVSEIYFNTLLLLESLHVQNISEWEPGDGLKRKYWITIQK
jgi:hypothetical protein